MKSSVIKKSASLNLAAAYLKQKKRREAIQNWDKVGCNEFQLYKEPEPSSSLLETEKLEGGTATR